MSSSSVRTGTPVPPLLRYPVGSRAGGSAPEFRFASTSRTSSCQVLTMSTSSARTAGASAAGGSGHWRSEAPGRSEHYLILEVDRQVDVQRVRQGVPHRPMLGGGPQPNARNRKSNQRQVAGVGAILRGDGGTDGVSDQNDARAAGAVAVPDFIEHTSQMARLRAQALIRNRSRRTVAWPVECQEDRNAVAAARSSKKTRASRNRPRCSCRRGLRRSAAQFRRGRRRRGSRQRSRKDHQEAIRSCSSDFPV